MNTRYVWGIALLTIAMIVLPAGAAPDATFPVLDNQVAIRQAHLAWKAAEQESGMNAGIAYIGTLEGADTVTLLSINSEFSALAGTIGSLDTHIGLNNAVRQMVQIGIRFRQEAHTQIAAGGGSWSDARAAIRDGLEKDRAQVDALEQAYWDAMETLTLQNFDTRTGHAQQVLDTLNPDGYGTTQAQATLDAITGKRAPLAAALAAHDMAQIRSTWNEIHRLSQDLAARVKDLQAGVPQEKRVRFWIGVGDRMIDRIERAMADLGALGVDTSSLDGIVEREKTDLKSAQDASAAGDLDGAVRALKELRQDLRDLVRAYHDLAHDGKMTRTAMRQGDVLASALELTADQMEEIV